MADWFLMRFPRRDKFIGKQEKLNLVKTTIIHLNIFKY
jgi:hypothetical protein